MLDFEFSSPPTCSIFSTPISYFFGWRQEVKAATPPCSTGLGDWRWIHPSPGFPQCPVNTIPRDGIGEVWGRNDDYFFCECVDVWGVGLVCFSFGKRRTTVPRASASCSERHRRREGAGATLSPCPTGVTVLAVPCLCELVHMCIIFLYR